MNFDLRKVSADDVAHAEERAMRYSRAAVAGFFGSLVAAPIAAGVGVLFPSRWRWRGCAPRAFI